jgi:hypothetical protein
MPDSPIPAQNGSLLDEYENELLSPKPIGTLSAPSAPLIPADAVPRLRWEIEARLQPASREEAVKGVAMLFGSFKIGDVVESAQAYTAAMVQEIGEFPPDILLGAIRQARRSLKWLPSIAEMVQICEELMAPRRAQLRALDRIEKEYEHRRIEDEKKAARQQNFAGQEAALEQKLVEHLGQDAPLPGDHATAFVAFQWIFGITSREFRIWCNAIDHAEHWIGRATRYMGIVGKGIELNRDRKIGTGQLYELVILAGEHESEARQWVSAVIAGEVEFAAI